MASFVRLGPALVVALALSMTAVACGGAVEPPGNDDPATPAPNVGTVEAAPAQGTDGGARCRDGETKYPAGSSDGCYVATGQVCGDYSPPSVCVNGAFQCPSGSVPVRSCWCFGMDAPRGNCTCTPSGWSCTNDAGAD